MDPNIDERGYYIRCPHCSAHFAAGEYCRADCPAEIAASGNMAAQTAYVAELRQWEADGKR